MGVFLIIAVIIFATIIYKKIKSNKDKFNYSYKSNEGDFKVDGRKERFVIQKNENFEFLVENAQIVACKDKRKSSEFIYYGGEK